MTAREYFEQARAAQRRIDYKRMELDMMRAREAVRAQSYDSVGHATGNRDVMRVTDARIDKESRIRDDLDDFYAAVDDARLVCDGVSRANPGQRWGVALMLRYIEDMPWHAVATALKISDRQAQSDCSAGLDWIDLVGLARAKEGMGQAELF